MAANLRREKDANDERTLSARFGLRWEMADWATANLTYYYQEQEVGSRQVNHRESFGTGRYESASRYLEPNDRENQLLALEVGLDGVVPLDHRAVGHVDDAHVVVALRFVVGAALGAGEPAE